MGMKGQPVAKYRNGKVVKGYNSAQEAAHDNGLTPYNLYKYMKSGSVIDGFTYQFGEMIRKKDPKPQVKREREAWEVDGMFDVDAWGKAL